jgi:uncharacterized surface protein with fasciclin (FAS1) repeats
MKLTLAAIAFGTLASTIQLAYAEPCSKSQVAQIPRHYVATEAAKEKPKTIVETAAGIEDFSTLVAAVKAAGLVETLSDKGPYTVFAPTNEAFAKLPEGTVEDLLKPENKKKLVAVLTYHVVPGKVMAADVVKVKEAKTAQGGKVKVTVKDDEVMINDSKVVKTDVECSNGVVHVIDSVLLPQ